MSKTSFNLLGVEFAPIWIPIERRLQVNIIRQSKFYRYYGSNNR